MKRLLALGIALAPLCAEAKEASISMMYSNAIDRALPFELVTTGRWIADPEARFVKLHLYFDEPTEVGSVELDACDGATRPSRFTLWRNFDDSVVGVPGDEELRPATVGRTGKTMYTHFEPGTEARSLTWNFEGWRGVELCALRVFDGEGKLYTLRVPTRVAGSVEASSTLAPESAYDVRHLFDSRFEYAWSSSGRSTGIDLAFRFDEPQRIEKLRIWNGYQRSVAHCRANARARRLRISGDGGYSAEVEVPDALGSQVLTLPSLFVGRELRISIAEAYPGQKYADLVISELRFGGPDGWLALDALPLLRTAAQKHREEFAKAGLGDVLGEGYTSSFDENAWGRLRLRADGSFYLAGEGSPASGPHADAQRYYFALGNFEVKKSDAEGMRLRLFGLYYETEAYGDCNGCGRDCNTSDDTSKGRIFEEHVRVVPVSKLDRIRFRVENESQGKKLPFRTLDLALESTQ